MPSPQPFSKPAYRSIQLQGVTDLTLFAEITPGFIPGTFETESRRERLQRVLVTLNAVRQASREAEREPSPFADSIGRFRGIHFFRFAVLPAQGDALADNGPDRLFLNVTFDGGWEPYMRIIWGPLGTLLDLIFCHCKDYPLAYDKTSYAEYIRWVRSHEVPSQFFYADSGATVADRQYLAGLEALTRSRGDAPDADRQTTALALAPHPPSVVPSPRAVETSLRVLAALFALSPLFPLGPNGSDQPHDGDHGILLRFAQDILASLRDWVAQGDFDPGGRYGAVRSRPGVNEQFKWLMAPRFRPGEPPTRLTFGVQKAQAGIARALPPDVSCGVLALFGVTDPAAALGWLVGTPVTREGMPPADGIYRNLALTFRGLRALGVPDSRLRRLPQEFIDGMEARAGVLGDLRDNHPVHWQRPALQDGTALELSAVHVLVQLRTAPQQGDPIYDGTTVLPRLHGELTGIATNGLQLLFAQPLRVNDPPAQGSPRRGHFGFVDGLSQPSLDAPQPAPSYFSDEVKPGELFMGYPNARDRLLDAPPDGEAGDLLLDDGSFLVVRKLRQHVDRLDAAVAAAAERASPAVPLTGQRLQEELKARMMGRRQDGTPLVQVVGGGGSNDFDYRYDAKGEQCPHAAHVRRANPRDSQPGLAVPRIARRGMSYGPPLDPNDPQDGAVDRGLVFMAYCASIAEQYEVIQRWLSGGNASGLSSAQSDPFLGVPETATPQVFRCVVDGQVMRVDLGRERIVSLHWGLYAFAPSPNALAKLRKIATVDPAPAPAPAPPPAKPAPSADEIKERWRSKLEDRNTRDAAWAAVRDKPEGVCPAGIYGVLVAHADAVLEVLQDSGAHFSAHGYGERMNESIGLGFLGQDDVGPHAGHSTYAPAVNRAIYDFRSEGEAFDDAQLVARAVLQAMPPAAVIGGIAQVQVDLVKFGGGVLAQLCKRWFGLPDEQFMKSGGGSDEEGALPPECPGHFLRVSRYVFTTPHPSDKVERLGKAQGKAITEAVQAWLQATDGEPGKRGPLTRGILGALHGVDDPQRAEILAGVMLGFPPTVLGNLVGVLTKWVGSLSLWELQRQLMQGQPAPDWVRAENVLRPALFKTMALAPVPYAVWRTAAKDFDFHGAPVENERKIVVGLGAAMQDPGADRMLMFGGRYGKPDAPVHACSGYRLAIGVMLGVAAALMAAGTLRPGATQMALTLVRKA